ncbi:MAG: thiamine-phosphate kinase [Desulfobulbaceae bacterium]|nr:MAG: thiamine-phosphate kinase [Desulfobulbaceae bacterium]
MITERELIAAIERRTITRTPAVAIDNLAATGAVQVQPPSGLLQGIGDDCAVWRPIAGEVSLVTTDTLVEGVHFNRSWHPPRLLGRKAVTVNMSDIAAMGGRPRFVLLSLGLNGDEGEQWINDLLDGLTEAVQEYRSVLIGGDTVRSPGGVMLAITVIGEATPGRVCHRFGGRGGDSVWVGGPLGLAAAGLELCRRGLADQQPWRAAVQAHLDPEAQVELGEKLAATGLIHAMIDLSDGLATDLAHLCEASGSSSKSKAARGAEIAAELLPIPEIVHRAARFCAIDPLSWALSGGEDYRLLFTTAPENDEAVIRLAAASSNPQLTRIGRLTTQPGIILRQNGSSRKIDYGGYDHFRSPS